VLQFIGFLAKRFLNVTCLSTRSGRIKVAQPAGGYFYGNGVSILSGQAARLEKGPFFNPIMFSRPNSRKKKTIPHQTNTFWRTLGIHGGYFLLAVLMNRFAAPGEIYPAGAAFFLAGISVRKLKWSEVLAIFAGSLVGIFSIRGFDKAIKLGALFLIMAGSMVYFNRKTKTKSRPGEVSKESFKTVSPIPIICIWAVLVSGLTAITSSNPDEWITAAVELTISAILMLAFRQGFMAMVNPGQIKSKYSMAALFLIIALAIGGTRELAVQSIKLTDVIVVMVVMMVSYIGGGGVSAAMGISIALITGIWSKNMIGLIALYGLSGFLGGFLREMGKIGTAMGGCLGLALITLQQPFHPGMIMQNLPWGIGMATFLMVPKKCFAQLSNCFPVQADRAEVSNEQKMISGIILDRLNQLAEIFAELARNFHEELQTQPAKPKMDLYSMLDEVSTKNCQFCNGYAGCWGENFYATYREIFDLIAYAELYGEVNAKHVKGRLAKSCFQQYKLLATINQLFERCNTEFQWQRKLNEGKFVLVDQLQGVSNLIRNLAREVNTDISFKYEIEDRLRHGFNRIGVPIRELTVMASQSDNLEIRIKQHNCNQKRECVYLAATLIGRLMGQEYSVWEKNCHLENGDCSYCLIPSYNYEIKTSVCKVPKEGNLYSGDNHSLHELKDGHFVAVLSDGMGNGAKAAIESSTTVSILNKLLEIGIDRDVAVRMVNSVLLLNSPAESFATIDIAQIDLYHGQAEFIKIGASATYLKRGKEVWSIKSTSLPAGILETIDIERTSIQLQPDDLIIMATDGVVDSKETTPGKEEWLIRALKQVEVVGPEALGEYLLSLAKINYEGIPKDDMSVIVLQVQEKQCYFD
jgi:stage II sporulation protein E